MATTTIDAKTHRTERKMAIGWATGLVLAIVAAVAIFFGIRSLSNRGELTDPSQPASQPIQELPNENTNPAPGE